MNNFLENCYCWIRQKDNSKKKYSQEDVLNIKLQRQLSCAGCFSLVNNISDFQKMAKIGIKQYGFCSEDCYGEWLLNPSAQFLTPINADLLAPYLCNTNKKLSHMNN